MWKMSDQRHKEKKLKEKWIQFLSILFFDSAREKMKRFIRWLEKSQETFEKLLYTCFKCGSNKIFSIAKHVRSADEETSVFNECRDCRKKWRDG